MMIGPRGRSIEIHRQEPALTAIDGSPHPGGEECPQRLGGCQPVTVLKTVGAAIEEQSVGVIPIWTEVRVSGA
jgi:hypothetical protein